MSSMYTNLEHINDTSCSIDTAIVHNEGKQWFLNIMFCLSFVFLCIFLFVLVQFNFFSY